ncbi:VOC family protein [Pseudomonas aeruginosa]|uniref:VOC family protein n=1 Tax=Pseudomonas aeruginosa TaxID=287 RepID=UPI0034D2EBFB
MSEKIIAVGNGPQYALPHVFMFPDQLAEFVEKFTNVFEGTSDPISDLNLAPVPATMQFTDLYTRVGAISAQAYKDNAPPFPMGKESVGFAVVDMDKAVEAAQRVGAKVLRRWLVGTNGEAMLEWPGGVRIQFYSYAGEAPEIPIRDSVSNTRYYLGLEDAERFVTTFLDATGGELVKDGYYPSEEIGIEGGMFRRVQINSTLGNVNVIGVTPEIRDRLLYPYTDIKTDFDVDDIDAALTRAKEAGVDILVRPEYTNPDFRRAVLRFPGEYVIEIHQKPNLFS